MMRRVGFVAMSLLIIGQSAALAGGVVTACASDVQAGSGLNLEAALAGGGVVRFNCPNNTVVRITRTHQLSSSVEVDGERRVTLRGEQNVPMFVATQTAARVIVRNITFKGSRGVVYTSLFDGEASDLELHDVEVSEVGRTPGLVFGFQAGTVIRANSILALNSRFRDNAGAVLMAPTLTIKHCEFRGNAGQPFMPHFIDEGGRAVIEDSTFSSNGVSVWRGVLEIRRSDFLASGRGSPAYGGALIVATNATIEKSSFINNRAPNGAAIWLAGGQLSLRRVRFEGNIASDAGGAIGVSNSSVPTQISVRHSHFRDNQARQGGAISFVRASAERRLQGFAVNFARNRARETGGAIDARGAEIDLIRVQAVENAAQGVGGFINGGSDFTTTRLANVLAVRNTAATGSAYVGLKLDVVNSTIADNRGVSIALLADHAATATLKNSVISNNTPGGCGLLPGAESGMIKSSGHNVQFPGGDCGLAIARVDPHLDSMYVPTPDSPLRFAGHTPTCLAAPINGRDLHNEVRPQARGQCTIGAIESTIERHALRKLRSTDAPGPLRELLRLLGRERSRERGSRNGEGDRSAD